MHGGEKAARGAAELFARAREADIAAVAGVKLFRAGRRLRGPCPLCGASKGKRSDGAFSADPATGLYKCFACDAGGDVVDLERAIRGGTAREAAERLAGALYVSAAVARPAGRADPTRPAAPRRAEGDSRLTSAERLALELWREAEPTIVGTLAAVYLQTRGLSAQIIGQVRGGLRFHPAAKWGWDGDRQSWIRAPAMIGRVRGPDGKTGGVHCTYLSADGTRKARLDPAKRMWGPQRDAQGRAGGVWLSDPGAEGPLVVGEGIESTLSAMQLLGRPCRGVATLSLGALQGSLLADRWGRVNPDLPTPDPERPAFTWPGERRVLIAVDRDMKPIRVKVRKFAGGTGERVLDSETRARLCAGLAAAAWRTAGANDVRVLAPAPGRDFSDELQARVGA